MYPHVVYKIAINEQDLERVVYGWQDSKKSKGTNNKGMALWIDKAADSQTTQYRNWECHWYHSRSKASGRWVQ